MKFVTSILSNNTNTPIDYVINTVKRSSPCDNCPNNPAMNKFATGVCHCTLNLPDIY